MRRTRVDFPDFRNEQMRLTDAVKKLPKWAGNATLNFYKDSWRREGYITHSFTPWPKRKKAQKRDRGILIKSGALRRSLRMSVSGNTITISTDMPYAKAHNEGAHIVQKVSARQKRFFWAMHMKAKKTKRTQEAEFWKRMALSTTLNIHVPQRRFMDMPDGPLSRFMQQRLMLHIERLITHSLP